MSNNQRFQKLYSAEKELHIVPGCIVCKTCEFLAPNLFVLREKALSSEVLEPRPNRESMPDMVEAIQNCPVNVIQYKKR